VFQAIRKRVIARLADEGERESKGIIIPNPLKDEEARKSARRFEVLSVGPLVNSEHPEIQPGVEVLATGYSHTGERLMGESVYTLDADAILAVLDEG
jgi:co-chaperonin GroES (HSP10)